jgi:hypothetical protein
MDPLLHATIMRRAPAGNSEMGRLHRRVVAVIT